MHNRLLQTRWLQDSLAVIEVADQPNVDVYVNNQLIGHTNDSGIVVTPWLVPYDRNTVRIDDRSIGMDAVLDSDDKVVVPMWRGGLFVHFAVEQSTGATLILQTTDGSLVPVGAVATFGDDEAEVAFHGEVFLPSLRVPARVHVQWPGHACDATVTELPQQILPKVGPIACK
jgi:outer membrane usher protein